MSIDPWAFEHRPEEVRRDFHFRGELVEEREEAFVAGDERHESGSRERVSCDARSGRNDEFGVTQPLQSYRRTSRAGNATGTELKNGRERERSNKRKQLPRQDIGREMNPEDDARHSDEGRRGQQREGQLRVNACVAKGNRCGRGGMTRRKGEPVRGLDTQRTPQHGPRPTHRSFHELDQKVRREQEDRCAARPFANGPSSQRGASETLSDTARHRNASPPARTSAVARRRRGQLESLEKCLVSWRHSVDHAGHESARRGDRNHVHVIAPGAFELAREKASRRARPWYDAGIATPSAWRIVGGMSTSDESGSSAVGCTRPTGQDDRDRPVQRMVAVVIATRGSTAAVVRDDDEERLRIVGRVREFVEFTKASDRPSCSAQVRRRRPAVCVARHIGIRPVHDEQSVAPGEARYAAAARISSALSPSNET